MLFGLSIPISVIFLFVCSFPFWRGGECVDCMVFKLGQNVPLASPTLFIPQLFFSLWQWGRTCIQVYPSPLLVLLYLTYSLIACYDCYLQVASRKLHQLSFALWPWEPLYHFAPSKSSSVISNMMLELIVHHGATRTTWGPGEQSISKYCML